MLRKRAEWLWLYLYKRQGCLLRGSYERDLFNTSLILVSFFWWGSLLCSVFDRTYSLVSGKKLPLKIRSSAAALPSVPAGGSTRLATAVKCHCTAHGYKDFVLSGRSCAQSRGQPAPATAPEVPPRSSEKQRIFCTGVEAELYHNVLDGFVGCLS